MVVNIEVETRYNGGFLEDLSGGASVVRARCNLQGEVLSAPRWSGNDQLCLESEPAGRRLHSRGSNYISAFFAALKNMGMEKRNLENTYKKEKGEIIP